MIKLELLLTEEEVESLRNCVTNYKDEVDFRESSQSEGFQVLATKVIAAIAIEKQLRMEAS